MASVRGSRSSTVVPTPTWVSSSTWPPSFSVLERTTSMPTPRPEMSETVSAVEKPGANTRLTISRSVISLAWASLTIPLAMALASTFFGSMPRPSSVMAMITWPPWW